VNKFYLESPDFLLVQKNSLKASLPPITISPKALGALVGSDDLNPPRRGIVECVVESGDNLWTIARDFEISLDSLLWANDLNTKSVLKVGQKLVIPPVSGIIHHVQSRDTISGIAQTYKAKTTDIISFNYLSQGGDIFIGDILVIPNGVMPPPQRTYQPQYVPLASSYFICPIASPCKITQGLHWYNAIDFSHGKCGEPIYATAAGEVLKVKLTSSTYRWVFGGAGNHITILHPNGVVTYYGHIATSLVSAGQQISQGQIIALIGGRPGTPGAGNSTGCHVHFAVSGARNPFAR
jgi:LysM repeat protein